MEVSMAATKHAKVVWKNGFAFDGSNDAGLTFRLDSPEAEGGPTGPSPMEVLLIGLAGCTAMDVISILKKKRQAVTGFEVHTHGVRADEHPKVYTEITIEYIVRGHQIDPKAVERAIELSETTYCSLSGMLKKAANIKTTYRIEEEA
jgi:putative redox protein